MIPTVYPKKYAHGFVVLCSVVVMQSFIMNSHGVFINIHQGCLAGTGAIVRLPQCQWSKPDGYGKISQCITTTKHSKAKTVCIFLGIYCMYILSKFTFLYSNKLVMCRLHFFGEKLKALWLWWWNQWPLYSALIVLKVEYSVRATTPLTLADPQQPWYWLCMIDECFLSTNNCYSYLLNFWMIIIFQENSNIFLPF